MINDFFKISPPRLPNHPPPSSPSTVCLLLSLLVLRGMLDLIPDHCLPFYFFLKRIIFPRIVRICIKNTLYLRNIVLLPLKNYNCTLSVSMWHLIFFSSGLRRRRENILVLRRLYQKPNAEYDCFQYHAGPLPI